ncbi:thioredoxin family protein [Kaarinaea lacus]
MNIKNIRRVDVTNSRQVEIFCAGCPACHETVNLVNRIACPSCEVTMLDMNNSSVAQRAKALGICRVPAVIIDGKLADCCAASGPDDQGLLAADIGKAI